jgi:lysophospholipid acyltransferase (LPLAT)-like uncharacterized protein
MKRFFKRAFKTEIFRRFICALTAFYIRLVYYTSRRSIMIEEGAMPYVRGDQPAVFAFWHGRLLMMPMLSPPKRKMQVMISNHRDGEMIARTMHHFGFGTLRGSSSKNGASVAMQAVKALEAGQNVSITPDGPRGPALKLQPGIVTVAELAKVPVLPVVYRAKRHRRMRSWDGFMVAYPFNRLTFQIGAPLWNADQNTIEETMVRQIEAIDAKNV